MCIRFEVICNLRKWAFLSAAAAGIAVIGCGGGGKTTPPVTTGGGIPSTSVTVNINENFGAIATTFLTGAGRAPGDIQVFVDRLVFEDQFGFAQNLTVGKTYNVNSYSSDIVRVPVPFANVPASSRLFEQFTLDFQGVRRENNAGGFVDLTIPEPLTVPARVRVYPGRDTSLPVYLSPTMFNVVGTDATLDVDEFLQRNGLFNFGDSITGFFNDYVSFDISQMDDSVAKPTLANGATAARIYVNGDNYALSAAGDRGAFEVLTANADEPIPGLFGPAGNIAGTSTPGTYSLYEADPSDIAGLLRIVAVQGTWRPYTQVLANFGTFEFITFPNARDDQEQEIAVVLRDPGTGHIRNFYFGYADFEARTFSVFPIANIVDGSVAGELSGTISNFVRRGGTPTSSPTEARYGQFNFTDGTLPAGFRSSGTFVVYRK